MLRCNRFNWLGELHVLETDQQVFLVCQIQDGFICIICTDVITFIKVPANSATKCPTMCLYFATTVNLKKTPPKIKTNNNPPLPQTEQKVKSSNFNGFTTIKFLHQNFLQKEQEPTSGLVAVVIHSVTSLRVYLGEFFLGNVSQNCVHLLLIRASCCLRNIMT